MPEFVNTMQANKWMAGAVIMFIGTMVTSQITSTGAFEVFINETLVFSKIQTG